MSEDLLNRYVVRFSEMWPEEKEKLSSLLTDLYAVQSEAVFEQFCEHITDIILAKDLEKLQLSINLARRMNFMIEGEPQNRSTSIATGRIGMYVAGLLILAVLVYYFIK